MHARSRLPWWLALPLSLLVLPARAGADPSALEAALSASAAQRASQVSNAVPVLDPMDDMTVNAGESADQALHATDADGDPLTFAKAAGPAYVDVTTTDPGTGSATGNVHVAPSPVDDGTFTVAVNVGDGLANVQGTFRLTVVGPNDPPVLAQPSDMAVPAGTTQAQALAASDADGDPLTFFLRSGPSYASVTTVDPGAGFADGILQVSPPLGLLETVTATVAVTDGSLEDEKTLTIQVTERLNAPPVLGQPADVDTRVGRVVDRTLNAADADGDPLTFSKVSGPGFVTITTVAPGNGVATGNAHIEPLAGDIGVFTVTARVTDGLANADKSFTVNVAENTPPVLNTPGSMFVVAGTTQFQYLYASDSDGDPIQFSKVSGPAYVTVVTDFPGSGFAQGRAIASPLASDVGTDTVVVSASDGISAVERSFAIFVSPPNRPPVLQQPADMTVLIGSIAEQAVQATDPDGDNISIFKSSGPAYMSVNQIGFGSSASARIRLAPGVGTEGTTTGSVTAQDFAGGGSDTKSFSITVTPGNFPPPCPTGSFQRVAHAAGGYPVWAAAADLNLDEYPDVVTTLDFNTISVFLGNGAGALEPRVDYAVGGFPFSPVIADLNGDEFPEILASNSNQVNILRGLGDGTFGPVSFVPMGASSQMLTVADLNRDGKTDIATANYFPPSVSIALGKGDGTFLQPTLLPLSSDAFGITAGDLTGDGAPELVVTQPGYSKVVILINNGQGSFTQTEMTFGSYPFFVQLADLDHDGALDLVTGDNGGGRVFVHHGNGDGTFTLRGEFIASVTLLAVGDFNGDGHPDVVTTDFETAGLYLGDGSGLLGPRTTLPAGSGPIGIATADFDLDLRSDLVVAEYYSNTVGLLLNRGCAPVQDRPPLVRAPRTATTTESMALTFTVTASDADGEPIQSLTADTSGLPVGHNATLAVDPSMTSGVFAWTPTYADARSAPYIVHFIARNALVDSARTKITVLNSNRAPTSNPGGPYTAFVDVPLQLDGRGSSDPDGETLLYSWVFGDGTSGVGATPQHTYRSLGVFGIALTVSDGTLYDLATTTATIVGVFPARAFTAAGNRTIRLTAGKPQWCAELEAVGRSFSNQAVDLGSIVMKSPGTGSVASIPAIAGKTVVGSDRDGNGVEEITTCFAKTDLRNLFSNLHGSTSATVTLEGNLLTGGIFRAMLDVGVIAGGGGNLAATVWPNPLNPSATLTFVTRKVGSLRVALYDLNGRLVRMLRDEGWAPAGYHDVAIDGRGQRGEKLASGVYFFRIQAAEGTDQGRLTVLK